MQPFDRINEYTKAVCEQIRWKKAHAVIREELENHIADQRDAYIAEGEEESAATERAITQMGDPVDVGVQLDRTHRPRLQWGMLCIIASLLLIGLAIRLMGLKTDYGYNSGRWTTWRQIACTILGIGVLAAAYFSDFTLLGKYPKTAFIVIAAIPAAFLLLPNVVYGKAVFAEYATLLFPLGFAAFVYAMRNKGYTGIILCELAFLLLSYIALKLPLISIYKLSTLSFLRFAIAGVAILCLANAKGWFHVKKRYGFLLVLAFIPIIFVIWDAWELYPFIVHPGIPYALSGAHLFGPGNPMLLDHETGQIMEGDLDTDNILIYIILKFGWISLILLFGVFIFFFVKGLSNCMKQKSSLGMMVSAAALIILALQLISVATTLFTCPAIGRVSLPFLSYGNTLTVINAALVGLMLSVFRSGDVVKDKIALPWRGISHADRTVLFKRLHGA